VKRYTGQGHTDTSGAQGTAPYRHQWGTGHSPIQTPVGHKAQAHTDTSGAQGTGPYRCTSGAQGMTNAELKVHSS